MAIPLAQASDAQLQSAFDYEFWIADRTATDVSDVILTALYQELARRV